MHRPSHPKQTPSNSTYDQADTLAQPGVAPCTPYHEPNVLPQSVVVVAALVPVAPHCPRPVKSEIENASTMQRPRCHIINFLILSFRSLFCRQQLTGSLCPGDFSHLAIHCHFHWRPSASFSCFRCERPNQCPQFLDSSRPRNSCRELVSGRSDPSRHETCQANSHRNRVCTLGRKGQEQGPSS